MFTILKRATHPPLMTTAGGNELPTACAAFDIILIQSPSFGVCIQLLQFLDHKFVILELTFYWGH